MAATSASAPLHAGSSIASSKANQQSGEAPHTQSLPLSSSTNSLHHATMTEKPRGASSRARSISQSRTTRSSSVRAEHRGVHWDVRTLPSWIDSFEEGDDLVAVPKTTDTLLSTLPHAFAPQHQHTPTNPRRRVSQDGYVDIWDEETEKKPETTFFGTHKEPVRGRKWDHAREGDPVIMRSNVGGAPSPWLTFLISSAYGHAPDEDTRKVDEAFLQQQTPGYEKPWIGDVEGGEDSQKLTGLLRSRKRRRTLGRRIQSTLLLHPYVPLIFRVTVLTTSTIALGLSCSIYHLAKVYDYPQTASTIMAIIVDTVAIPYIVYITWDEYTGKPLGLRSPKAKIRLVLLDLWFIVFEAANLALAFASLTDDNGSCKTGFNGYNGPLCHRVETLCSILLIALIAWTMTFVVSIYRLVERVGGREDGL